MDFRASVPDRYSVNALSALNPELLVGVRTVKGALRFVDSTAAAGGNGNSWDGAYNTLQGAVDGSAAGDVLLVAAGSSFTMTAAGTLTVNKAGLTFIGLGNGRRRPNILYSTAVAASVDVTSANCHFINFYFDGTGIDAVTAMVNVQAADCAFEQCDVEHADSGGQATLGILTNASGTRLRVSGCRFYGSRDAGTAAAVRIVGGDGHIIEDSIFSGNYTSGIGGLENVTTACTNTIVRHNVIQNFTASSTKAMVFVSTSDGQIFRNYMQILSGTAPITGAAMSWAGGNYYAAVIATAGTLI